MLREIGELTPGHYRTNELFFSIKVVAPACTIEKLAERIGEAVDAAVVGCFAPGAAIVVVTPVEAEQQVVDGLFVE